MTSVALLIVRSVVGGLLAGHGAQKLFGAFGGYGMRGTAGWLESMNLRPGQWWAALAGLSEFGGGLLSALGALNPIGPVLGIGSMLTATLKAHRGKPIWVTAGGAELPITNISVLTAVAIAGPGKLSVDGLLGIRLPRWFGFAAFVTMIVGVVYAVRSSEPTLELAVGAEEQDAGAKLQAGPAEDIEPTEGRDDAPEGRPDLGKDAPSDRPGVESWGSPDAGEAREPAAVAATERPREDA